MAQMKTIKWFKVGIPLSLDKFVQKLKTTPFQQGVQAGFILKKITPVEIAGKFIEEKPFVKEITNPFGDTQTFSAIDYNIIEFKFSNHNDIWLLEIYHTPRSIKNFTNTLSHLLDFRFSISTIQLNIKELIEQIERDIGSLSVTKIEVNNINIQNIALGQLLISSTKDIRQSLESYLLTNTGHTIHYINARFNHHPYLTGSFEIRNNSRIDISDMPNHAFLELYKPIFLRMIQI